MDTDLAFVAVSHGDGAAFFVAAGSDGCSCALLFDGEASLAEDLDDWVGEFDLLLRGGGEELE